MPDINTIYLFALACLALNASPGPDMLLIATRSATLGSRAGLVTYFGIATGAYCHALALALGLSQLFFAVPMAYDIVRFAGAAYLLYLAWQAFTTKIKFSDKPQQVQALPYRTLFRQGFLTNILNPKVALFFLALFPQFIDPFKGTIALQVLILATILNISGLIVNGLVILIANQAGARTIKNTKLAQYANYATGIIFTGLASRLILSEGK